MTSELPEGWTDDMNVAIGNGRSVQELAESIMQALLERATPETILNHIAREFALSVEDAELSLDRAQGGIVRAATGNIQNKPDQAKDPIAFYTFQEAWRSFPRAHWLGRRRVPSGAWLDWVEARLG